MSGKRNPKFVLMYPPQQFVSGDSIKPDGTLGLAYLAGALRRNGFEVRILDACAGSENTTLEETFFKKRELANGLYWVGMSNNQIVAEIANFDVVGITSNFTSQTTRVLELIKAVKEAFPEKLVISGGVNARNQLSKFFQSGCDLICLSEAENTIVEIGKVLRQGLRDFRDIGAVAYRSAGKLIVVPAGQVETDLDLLPFPAWDLMPLQRYWDISRPRSGIGAGEDQRFASLMTSRGCPRSCLFCHISGEDRHPLYGNIKRFRTKSLERVLQEFDILKGLGVKHVFFEDESLLTNKSRAMKIFRRLQEQQLVLRDVNGINVNHLFRKTASGQEVDIELLALMVDAGFAELSLPFESASKRIQESYCSNKLNLELDTVALVKTAKSMGLMVSGGFMIGFPDETEDEMTSTIMLAKRLMDAGMDAANLRCVVPYPGSRLYQMAVEGGYLDADFNPDGFVWLNPTMKNTAISPEVLKYVNRICWMLLNPPSRVDFIKSLGE